jgi:hypothetical protein
MGQPQEAPIFLIRILVLLNFSSPAANHALFSKRDRICYEYSAMSVGAPTLYIIFAIMTEEKNGREQI